MVSGFQNQRLRASISAEGSKSIGVNEEESEDMDGIDGGGGGTTIQGMESAEDTPDNQTLLRLLEDGEKVNIYIQRKFQ